MAFDTYMQLKDIEGESTATGNEKWIEIFSFSWGASNPTTIGSGATGISAGRVSISSFNIMKKTELSSTKLFAACCSGKHIEDGKVQMRKASGDAGQKVFLEYDFTSLMVESIQWSGSTGGDDTPTESVSFAFATVAIKYYQQATKGGAMEVKGNASWDLTKVAK